MGLERGAAARRALCRIWRGRWVRSVGVLAGGAAAGQVIVLATAPVLTRLYEPSDYGVLAIYGAILALLGGAAALRYDFAITLPEDDSLAADLTGVALVAVLLLTGVLTVGAVLLRHEIAAWINEPALAEYVWLVPLGFCAGGVYHVFLRYAIREQAFSTIARTRLTQSVAKSVTQVGLGALGWNAWGLLTGDVVGRVNGTMVVGRVTWRSIATLPGRVTAAGMATAARRYGQFAFLSAPSVVINSAGVAMVPLLITRLYGAEVTGLFALGQRVVVLPMTLIGQAVGQVYLSEVARLARGDLPRFFRVYRDTALALAGVAVIPTIVLALWGAEIFSFAFGGTWTEAGRYAEILSILLFMQFVTSPISQNFSVLERHDLSVAWNLGRLLLVVGVFSLALWQDYSPLTFMMFYSAAMASAYGILLVLSGTAIQRAGRAQRSDES